jgi:hypothetical protein
LTEAERKSIDNAIWLCRNCGTVIDRDPSFFTADMLRDWKRRAENRALLRTRTRSEYRAIAPTELHTHLTPGERALLLELGEEFGCEVKWNTQVPYEGGWVNLHAAVVRGEDLIAIEIREYHGGGFPFGAEQYLIEVGPQLKFPRFRKFVVYVAVVSDATAEQDAYVREGLTKMAGNAPCEVYIRMYRLKELLAKHDL